jgi:hypothetical protein
MDGWMLRGPIDVVAELTQQLLLLLLLLLLQAVVVSGYYGSHTLMCQSYYD